MSIYGQVDEGALSAPAGPPKVTSPLDNLTDEQKKQGGIAAGVLFVFVVGYYAFGGGGTAPGVVGGSTEVTMDCLWTVGDGVGEGGTEQYLGDTKTRKDCVNLVLQTATGANGATYSQTDHACEADLGCKRCYAEYNIAATNGNTNYQTCTLAGQLIFTPVSSDWTVMGCDWVAGDGVGGQEREITTEVRDMAHCVEEVMAQYPQANGATARAAATTNGGAASGISRGDSNQEYQCFAELGMNTAEGSNDWHTCLFIPSYCTYEPGDGIGGSEELVGHATSARECVNMVLERAPGANGATFISTGGTDCYAEFGMTSSDSTASNWRTCRFPEARKVCEFEVGDGTGHGGAGGSETYVGELSDPWSCYHAVREQFPGANGVTFPGANGCQVGGPDGEAVNGGYRTCRECYAEFGMEEADGDVAWTTCKMEAVNLHQLTHNPALGGTGR